MPDERRRVLVAGAGLAGLAAARAALDAGADVEVREALPEPGGATVDSAGWIWRYRDMPTWRRHAPMGDAHVQQLVLNHLDPDLAWLERLGVHPRVRDTQRAWTTGWQVDPREVVDRLVASIGHERIMTHRPLTALEGVEADAVVLAGGGYAGDLGRVARESGLAADATRAWTRRPRVANDGSTMELALDHGARRSITDGQCLVRLVAAGMGADVDAGLLAAVSELHLPAARLRAPNGVLIPRDTTDWSGATQLRMLQLAGTEAVLELDADLLDVTVHAGRVGDIVDAARSAGARIEAVDGGVRIAVRAGITHTWCGVDVDVDARIVLDRRSDVDLFAAGCDAAGTGLGGTASGLAQALVLGRRAGTAAARG